MTEATPRKSAKVFRKGDCFLCSREELNSRKRRSLERSELQQKISELLHLLPEEFTSNSNRYICETPCYRDLDKFFKLKANCETLKSSILQRFEGTEQRIKRCLPSDVQPHQSPELKKSRTGLSRVRIGRSLTFHRPSAGNLNASEEHETHSTVQQFLGP